jgi:hypothetical protein
MSVASYGSVASARHLAATLATRMPSVGGCARRILTLGSWLQAVAVVIRGTSRGTAHLQKWVQ